MISPILSLTACYSRLDLPKTDNRELCGEYRLGSVLLSLINSSQQAGVYMRIFSGASSDFDSVQPTVLFSTCL